jgi:poly-beta-1,6-N-acetyl-D-glucosamine synthase
LNLTLLIIILLYAAVLLFFCLGFILQRFKEHSLKNYPTVSIIIAARNEEKNILACLRSIYAQNYDGEFEVILVDDASSDRTHQVAKDYFDYFDSSGLRHRLIRNESSLGKKQSLQNAIQQSNAVILVSRDADTFTTNPDWLKNTVSQLTATKSDMVIGPIGIHTGGSLLSYFEWLENAVLTVVSGGASYFHQPFLASGANLAFTRDAYNQVKGYSSHLHIRSGDDVFLLRDLKTAGKKITYLKSNEGVVTTYAADGFRNLISQKIRWSGKIFQGFGPGAALMAILILAANVLWIFSLIKFSTEPGNKVHLTVLILKIATDSVLVFVAANFFRKLRLTWLILPMSLVYPVYSILIAFGTLLIKPRWK